MKRWIPLVFLLLHGLWLGLFLISYQQGSGYAITQGVLVSLGLCTLSLGNLGISDFKKAGLILGYHGLLIPLALWASGHWQIMMELSNSSWWVLLLLNLSGPVIFYLLKAGIKLWNYWKELRQRHIRWYLSHSQMMLLFFIPMVYTLYLLGPTVFNMSREVMPGSIVDAPWHILFYDRVCRTLLPSLIFSSLIVLISMAALFPLSALLSFIHSKRLLRPINDLQIETQRISQGEKPKLEKSMGQDELAMLHHNVLKMADQLIHQQDEIAQQKERSDQLLLERRRWMARLGHEIKTPLTGLALRLETLSKKGEADKEELESLGSQVLYLQELVEDFFRLARADLEPQNVILEEIPLQDFLNEIARSMKELAHRQGKTQIKVAMDETTLNLCSSPKKLEQILINLIKNSLDHTAPGGLIIIEAKEMDGGILIAVRDTGGYIDPQQEARLWEPHQRGDSRNHNGTGLGLWIVKDLCQELNAQITLHRNEVSGSSFEIFFS